MAKKSVNHAKNDLKVLAHHLAPASPYRAAVDGSFQLSSPLTEPSKKLLASKNWKQELATHKAALYETQQRFYADGRFSILIVFQAMDAAGKDSTIRHVFSGVNPAGFRVESFKQPSEEELEHDFLWRHAKVLPRKGKIGVFNRSHYEEVLVTRVHPEYLASQHLPPTDYDFEDDRFWAQRYQVINAFEQNLVNTGTLVLKFFLNVSQKEQHKRFMKRLEREDKHWKFASADLSESRLWPKYMHAYEQAIQHTSSPWAPWYVIPADDKKYMRNAVAETVLNAMNALKPQYPKVTKAEKAQFDEFKNQLKNWE